MTWSNFLAKYEKASAGHKECRLLYLNPQLAKLPLPIQRFDDPFFPFAQRIIDISADLVCGYVFNLASYLALGAAGARALERTIAYAGRDHLRILHGPFTGREYSGMADATGLNIDALTLTDFRDLQHYLVNPPYAAFVVRDELQEQEIPEEGGLMIPGHRLIVFRNSAIQIQSQLTGDDVLYAGKLEDFDVVVRERLLNG